MFHICQVETAKSSLTRLANFAKMYPGRYYAINRKRREDDLASENSPYNRVSVPTVHQFRTQQSDSLYRYAVCMDIHDSTVLPRTGPTSLPIMRGE